MEELKEKVIEGMKIQKDRFGRINFDSAFNWAARQIGLPEESYPSRKRAVKKALKKEERLKGHQQSTAITSKTSKQTSWIEAYYGN